MNKHAAKLIDRMKDSVEWWERPPLVRTARGELADEEATIRRAEKRRAQKV